MNREHCVHMFNGDGKSVLVFFKHQRNYLCAVHAASERKKEYAKWKAVQLLHIYKHTHTHSLLAAHTNIRATVSLMRSQLTMLTAVTENKRT